MRDILRPYHRRFGRRAQPRGAWSSDSETFEFCSDAPDLWGFEDELRPIRMSLKLYDPEDIRAALGQGSQDSGSQDSGSQDSGSEMPPDEWTLNSSGGDPEQRSVLEAILRKGKKASFRFAHGPKSGTDAGIAALVDRAPHFAAFGDLLRVNAKAALTIGLPMFLNPVLLVGAHGIGKTWFLSRLAGIMGLPFRSYSMSISTLGEGLQGSHPSWRNSEPGLVAKTLLRETQANSIIFVDEFDKVTYGAWNRDPYRPFYTLLDPSGSRGFVDEYLGFPMNASKLLWVMAANDVSGIPAPIMDRLSVFNVPEPTSAQRRLVIQSIYDEANAARRSFFEPALSDAVLERLLPLNPRGVRLVVEAAMANAAADGRHALRPPDIKPRQVHEPSARTIAAAETLVADTAYAESKKDKRRH